MFVDGMLPPIGFGGERFGAVWAEESFGIRGVVGGTELEEGVHHVGVLEVAAWGGEGFLAGGAG